MTVGDLLVLWAGSYWRLARCVATARPVGPRRLLALLVAAPLLVLVQTAHWVCLLLDELLFPDYREVRIERPLFIVGMPRSGTSLLHETLARDHERFTTTELWEPLLAPSIVQRRCLAVVAGVHRALGRPFRRLLEAPERLVADRMRGVHAVDLREPGEDFLFLLPALGCFLLVALFPSSPAIWELTRIDGWPERRRLRLLRLYRACLQRRLYATRSPGRRVLAKNPSFTACVGTLRELFPDALFLFCFRDPAEAIPSQLSSFRPAAALFGYEAGAPPARDLFVGMFERFVRRGVEAAESEPHGTVGLVPYSKLTGDVAGSVLDIYRSFGWEVSPEYGRRLAEAAEDARGHRSGHRYDLAEFGLSASEVRARFGGALDRLHVLARRRTEAHA